jgi:hypothetical protein
MSMPVGVPEPSIMASYENNPFDGDIDIPFLGEWDYSGSWEKLTNETKDFVNGIIGAIEGLFIGLIEKIFETIEGILNGMRKFVDTMIIDVAGSDEYMLVSSIRLILSAISFLAFILIVRIWTLALEIVPII